MIHLHDCDDRWRVDAAPFDSMPLAEFLQNHAHDPAFCKGVLEWFHSDRAEMRCGDPAIVLRKS